MAAKTPTKLKGKTFLGILEDKILFIVALNPSHKLVVGDEISKITNMFTSLIEGVDSLMNDIRTLSKVTDKTF